MIQEAEIRELALGVGLDDAACVAVRRLDDAGEWMDKWVAQGLHGKMDYLSRNCDKRYNPGALVEGAETIVVGLLTYEHSGRDYHRTVKSKLYALEAAMRDKWGEEVVVSEGQHIFCDSAPMLERRWCIEAGLGYIGRNHQLIHPTLGSMVHPGELVLNTRVAIPQKDIASHEPGSQCGNCHRCQISCPTGALREPVWDARKCVAYETNHCLECQRCCPHGQRWL